MPMDWQDQPEASGPVTELPPRAYGDGLDRFPEASGPMDDRQDLNTRYVTIGRIENQLDQATIDRERAEADRRFYLQQQVERAALAAGLNALQAAEAATRLQQEAAQAADKAVNRS
jgi:hypothetical protein